MNSVRGLSTLVLLLLTFAGCASPLPAYNWENETAAVAALAARSESIRSVRATATLVLTSADNQHVTLDAAIVARSRKTPDGSEVALRIRTWKFSQAVFDLTAKPEGVWLASDSAGQQGRDRLRSLKPENIARAWGLFFGDFFAAPGLTLRDNGGPTMIATRTEEGATITCEIDKRTLTVRRYTISDSQGRVHQTLSLSRYQLIDNTPWPMLIVAVGDEGHVQVRFDEAEINPDLDDTVFNPPSRAVKLP